MNALFQLDTESDLGTKTQKETQIKIYIYEQLSHIKLWSFLKCAQ